MKIDNETRAKPRRRPWWKRLRVLAAVYVLAYICLRASGDLYPFYNQGSWDAMDWTDRAPTAAYVIFLPLSKTELVYHNCFTPPPAGG
jgi:hypothetical protein